MLCYSSHYLRRLGIRLCSGLTRGVVSKEYSSCYYSHYVPRLCIRYCIIICVVREVAKEEFPPTRLAFLLTIEVAREKWDSEQ